MESMRMQRVNEAVREVVSEAIVDELTDPRIGFVTVTQVKVSPDLKHARVFITVMGEEKARDATLSGLASSHGPIQAKIARDLKLKHTPMVEFVYDENTDKMFRIDELLRDEDKNKSDR